MIGLYIGLISSRSGVMSAWFVAGLAAAGLLSIYGAARSKPWDLVAAIAAAFALIMVGLYIGLIRQQGGPVAAWFVAGLAAAAFLSVYGVARAAPRRALALLASGVVMTVLGFLAILSIGLPILGAGVLALVAAARARDP
jgi:hypothetical protein